jgi:hypothetical protein
MKNFIILLLIVMIGNTLLAQENVGIGTSNPHSSAALDISGNDLPENGKKGFLMPRVNLLSNTDIVTIPSPAEGLLVYNLQDNSSDNTAVYADSFYFWDGSKWVDFGDIQMVKSILLPQVFFITDIYGQNTVLATSNINTQDVIVTYGTAEIVINTGENVELLDGQIFKILKSGTYEVSGYINYNPSITINQFTNVEYVFQLSTDNGSTWVDAAKTTMVWGLGTGANSRTNSIAPMILNLTENNRLRCIVRKTNGANHGSNAGIRASTGMTYSKLLKIQKLD